MENRAKEVKEQGMTVKKSDDLSEWYNEVVVKAELADHSGAKGFMFIRPYGYAVWENIQGILDSKLKKLGHKNAYSPALIPERLLSKEAEHVKGFAPEAYVVTHAGSEKLAERYVLRPTSETIIYESYAKWIRSHRQLPLLWNFWNSVFRAEIKMTKLFLRTSEFLWQEGHTVHATEEDCDREVMLILDAYRDLIENYLAIPVVSGKKSEREKFAGALYTTTLEALMPDGRALQMGTSHNLGQNFSKAFSITFLDADKQRKHAWQASWGVSTRMIGALIMVHGDDKGLILPPRIAPVQIVIIPILFEKSKDAVLKKAKEMKKALESSFRVELDDREDYTPGWKFNEHELRGVPLRIEIGPKDIEKNQAVAVRRDTSEKIVLRENLMEKEIKKLLEEIQKGLYAKAKNFLEQNVKNASDLEEVSKHIGKRMVARVNWCGDGKCEEAVKEKAAATLRVIRFDETAGNSRCFCCGKKALHVAYFSKAY
ncbi:MAG: proline--tRNA ligase [Candidatus Aenigmarchaeota archaeon]|nr:proline--tRNA ligase [Candidatus Aenigmarchaeota archaeon]